MTSLSNFANPCSLTPGEGFQSSDTIASNAASHNGEAVGGMIQNGQASPLYGANSSEEILNRLTKKQEAPATTASGSAAATLQAGANYNV